MKALYPYNPKINNKSSKILNKSYLLKEMDFEMKLTIKPTYKNKVKKLQYNV